MERISIQEIASILTAKSGLKKKDAERFATTIFEVVKDGLEAERLVKIKGLGTFKVIDIEARESVNINTGERVLIEGHGKVTFTPDATMKELVNKPFSQFETVVLNEGVDFDDMDNSDDADAETTEAEPETVVEEVVAEPEPEPVVEEPEPVIQEPEPEPEPVVEEPEPEPVVQEPLPILDVFEPEQPEQPQEEEPAAEESADEEPIEEPIEDTTEDETEEQEETYMSDNNSGKRTHWVWLLAGLFACAGSFALGYYLGLNKGRTDAETPMIEEIAESKDTLQKQETVVPDSTTLKNSGVDEPAHAVEPAEPVAEVESPVVETPKPAPKQEEAPKAKPESAPAVPDKFEQMDARVRTGAYRIVGADYDVKVKAGETTARVAKRTLGPDMECYIEVFNGLNSTSELKEGQTLKIPKLELKKKKKQNK